MNNDDIRVLQDCIVFVIEHEEELDEVGINKLWEVNLKLLSLKKED